MYTIKFIDEKGDIKKMILMSIVLLVVLSIVLMTLVEALKERKFMREMEALQEEARKIQEHYRKAMTNQIEF